MAGSPGGSGRFASFSPALERGRGEREAGAGRERGWRAGRPEARVRREAGVRLTCGSCLEEKGKKKRKVKGKKLTGADVATACHYSPCTGTVR